MLLHKTAFGYSLSQTYAGSYWAWVIQKHRYKFAATAATIRDFTWVLSAQAGLLGPAYR